MVLLEDDDRIAGVVPAWEGMMERMGAMTFFRKTRVIVSFWRASSEVVA